MGIVDTAVMIVTMLGIVAPMVGVTWYSIRDEFHTPHALRDTESETVDAE